MLVLALPKNGGRSVGIVRSRTQATELLLLLLFFFYFQNLLCPSFPETLSVSPYIEDARLRVSVL
jgi:hypothetical protein